MSLLPDDGPPGDAAHDGPQPPAVTVEDIDSLLPGRTVTMRVIEEFFRSQFAACLRQQNVEANLESCLVFGPDTFADLRRLLLGGGQPGAGQQGFPALERFCREHDIAGKQYLLLPLLTPSHGSLLVLCQPVEQPAGGGAAGSLPPLSHMQQPLLLHLDSLSGHGSLKGHAPDCAALTRFLRPHLNMSYHKLETMAVLTASVPQQGSPGLGPTFLCTSALYFAASLPPILYADEVVRLKNYKQEPADMYEREDGKPWYPGFLTTEWYPRNVPEALRKVLLSAILNQVQGQSGQSEAAAVVSRAGEVQKMLHATSARQFEMPAERLMKQSEMKRGRQLSAGRRLWERNQPSAPWLCKRGLWTDTLTEDMLEGRGPCFADVRYFKSSEQYQPPKPQQFEMCFGVQLNQGQRPPSFIVHTSSKQLQGAADPAVASDQAELQLEMRFASEPVVTSQGAGWLLEKACWESLRRHLPATARPGHTLRLVQRPGTGGKQGMVHVDLDVLSPAELYGMAKQEKPATDVHLPTKLKPAGLQKLAGILPPGRPRGSQPTAGAAAAPAVVQHPGGPGMQRAAGTPDVGALPGGRGSPRSRAPTPDADAAVGGQGSQAGRSPIVSLGGPNSMQQGGVPHAAVLGGGGGTQQAAAVLGGGGGAQQAAATPDVHDPTLDAPGSPQHTAATPDVHDPTLDAPGSPQHTAGTADLAEMAAASSLAALHTQPFWAAGSAGGAAVAAAVQPTSKGIKRLQTGKDGQGDRRARLTVRGKKYYAGYFPTGAAAAQAEDLMVLWVHSSSAGWPAGWMQSWAYLNHKLNYPYAFHLATHKKLVASLSSCADNGALRRLLQQHLNPGGQQQPDEEEPSLQLASQGSPPASPCSKQPVAAAAPAAEERMQLDVEQRAAGGAGEKRPADSAAAGSSLGAKRQRGAEAASGERLERTHSLRSSGTARDAQQQQGKQQRAGQHISEELEAILQRLQQALEQQEPGPLPTLGGLDGGPPQQPASLLGDPFHSHGLTALLARQQSQQPREAASAAGGGSGQTRPASSAMTVLHSVLQGGSGDSSDWPQEVRQQAADALAAATGAAPEHELIAAQVDAIIAALHPLGVPFSARLACTRRFRQLPAAQRFGLLAELRSIALLGSMADLLDWMQEVGGS